MNFFGWKKYFFLYIIIINDDSLFVFVSVQNDNDDNVLKVWNIIFLCVCFKKKLFYCGFFFPILLEFQSGKEIYYYYSYCVIVIDLN